MGYAREPAGELAVLRVATLLDGHNRLDERLLEDVVGHILIFHYVEYIGIDLVLMTCQQYIKSIVVFIGVSGDQFTVRQLSQIFHWFLECFG